EMDAVAKDGGIFEVSASWLTETEPIDIVFKLTLPDNEDLLTGRLERTVAAASSQVTFLDAFTDKGQTTLRGFDTPGMSALYAAKAVRICDARLPAASH